MNCIGSEKCMGYSQMRMLGCVVRYWGNASLDIESLNARYGTQEPMQGEARCESSTGRSAEQLPPYDGTARGAPSTTRADELMVLNGLRRAINNYNSHTLSEQEIALIILICILAI